MSSFGVPSPQYSFCLTDKVERARDENRRGSSCQVPCQFEGNRQISGKIRGATRLAGLAEYLLRRRRPVNRRVSENDLSGERLQLSKYLSDGLVPHRAVNQNNFTAAQKIFDDTPKSPRARRIVRPVNNDLGTRADSFESSGPSDRSQTREDVCARNTQSASATFLQTPYGEDGIINLMPSRQGKFHFFIWAIRGGQKKTGAA